MDTRDAGRIGGKIGGKRNSRAQVKARAANLKRAWAARRAKHHKTITPKLVTVDKL